MYHFSAPMPYSIENINRIVDINKQIEKSAITSLYACVPRECEVFTGFEQSRNLNYNNSSWDYWKRLINHTLDSNCDFIYLLNSPRPINIENSSFSHNFNKLEILLDELKKIGVKNLRIASVQLIAYILEHYSDFNVCVSTSLEYKTIWEYQNLIHFNRNIKQIVPSHDINKNFKLLSNLRKRYPKIEIELMVNEGCLQGCHNRVLHEMMSNENVIINNEYFSNSYFTSLCSQIIKKYPIQSLVICNNIFPWQISEYSKIGINKFKFVGRDAYITRINEYIKEYLLYLKAVDNYNEVKDVSIVKFVHHLSGSKELQKLSINDVYNLLPKINYFKKYGHLCSSKCGIECFYCYKCAEKIQKIFEKQQKNFQKANIPICVMSK